MGRPTVAVSSLLLLFATALITLANAVNNFSPEITSVPVHLPEDIPENEIAFTINATDRDGNKLHYALSGANARFFSANPDTGVVTIKSPLDRETHDTFEVMMEVDDGGPPVSKKLTIILIDANDNDPIFWNSPYNVNVDEDTKPGTSLFKVSATDDDTGTAASVTYNIDEVIPVKGETLFTLNNRNGEVKLSQSLNYNSLSSFYRLKINASDGGGPIWNGHKTRSSVAYAFITVVDKPDLDPRFLTLPYRGSVAEGSKVGTPVLTVNAVDQDMGLNYDILYSINGSGQSGQPDLFIISETGEISVNSAIDRETIGGSVTLTVKATEVLPNIHGAEAFVTAPVQISIEDMNDNKPLFYHCGTTTTCVEASQFRGEIFENSAVTFQINMTVKDPDQDARIELKLEGVDKDAFAVTPSVATSESKVQLVVQDSQQIDFETKEEMVVQVIAIDGLDPSMRSTATVTIKILDTNDNSPTFPKDTYNLEVDEHSPNGTLVGYITAEDLDKIDQGGLTYRLLPESIRNYFDVKLRTGEVYVTNSARIDREVRSLYTATLQARDTNNNTGTTVLEISLTDINDRPPIINRDSYIVFVKEGQQFEVKIEATDADDPEMENSKIVFAIMPSKYSGNFTINPDTGMLTNSGLLDREALDPKMDGKIELNVTATDRGIPALDTMVKVIINIEDINDNEPIFNEASYDFSVKEGEKGAFVGLVQAMDLDQALDFNRISFSILNGSFGSFIIRTSAHGLGYRGNITVDPDLELDYESVHNHFTLRVEGADLSQSKAEVNVKIKVLDVNDERPEFQPLAPLEVKENSTVTGVLGSISAVDKDGNHSLVYQMESCECRCNKTFKPCDWMLLDTTGEVTVNPDATLDYEQCDQVVIKAQVVDEYTEKGENNSISPAEIVVNIVDINDNAPEFLNSDAVFVLVSETASKGTPVARVTATDRDTGINKEIKFKVTEVRFKNTNSEISPMRTIFEAVTTQQDYYVGIIQSIEELDSNLNGKYLVTVSATDGGDLSTSTELEISIVHQSFKIELRFEAPLLEVISNQESIIAALTAATKAAVYVVSIKPDTAQSRAPDDTIMESYFVYHNGTAISSDSVEKMLSDPEHYLLLRQYGLANIGTGVPVTEPPDPVQFVLLGLVGGLIIVLIVLSTSLVCTRRSYRTKLKAANAMKSTTMEATDNHGGPIVPGTNKYTMEGANPVLNLNIDTVTDLGFEEENSNTDRISVNSFDDDMSLHSENDRTMMVIQEEDEESIHIEPLGAALAQRANKQDTANSQMGFTNPAFSTTDL